MNGSSLFKETAKEGAAQVPLEVAQRSATKARDFMLQAAPVALPTKFEREWVQSKAKFISECLTAPDGAKKLERDLVGAKISFPERDRILAFYKIVVIEKYNVENRATMSSDSAIRERDAQKLADSMKKYFEESNRINLKYGVAQITEMDVQNVVLERAKKIGMKEDEALKFVQQAAKLAGFGSIISTVGPALPGLDISTSPYPAAVTGTVLALREMWTSYEEKERETIREKILSDEDRKREGAKAAAPATEAVKEFENRLEKNKKEFERIMEEADALIRKSTGAAGTGAGAAGGTAAAAEEMKAPKPLAEAAAQRIRKAPAPEAEYAKPPDFGGGAAIKVAPNAKAAKIPEAERISDKRAAALIKIRKQVPAELAKKIDAQMAKVATAAKSDPAEVKRLREYIIQAVNQVLKKPPEVPPPGSRQAMA